MTMLEKRVVLITGASRGIGAATARLLAKHGAAVAVNYINNAAAAERVVQDITSGGGRAIAVQADVRVRDEFRDRATGGAVPAPPSPVGIQGG